MKISLKKTASAELYRTVDPLPSLSSAETKSFLNRQGLLLPPGWAKINFKSNTLVF